jgi:hypothetical protein
MNGSINDEEKTYEENGRYEGYEKGRHEDENDEEEKEKVTFEQLRYEIDHLMRYYE